MFSLESSIRYFMCQHPVNMRKGIDSLSCSYRLCGVDFFEYLTDVINRVAAMGAKATADTCRDLLPDKWEKQ